MIKVRSPKMKHVSRTHRVNLIVWSHKLGFRHPNQKNNTSKADIVTKGPCCRDRWLQLTQLFNPVTPHMHSCSHALVFSFEQKKDDKMSKRLPEPVTENASAKQRPVRNVCAYRQHSSSSSSSSISPKSSRERSLARCEQN